VSDPIVIPPNDSANQGLVAHTHPPDWVNPDPQPKYNLVVIGGGTAGLVCASIAAGIGAKVAMVERHLLGGDCLNFGCVPSKTLIRSAKAAAEVRDAGRFGVNVPEGVTIDFDRVMARVREVRNRISHHDSAERFRDLGVDVFLGDGAFSGPDTIEVAGKTLRFTKAVIATGARAIQPPIEGLAEAGCLTNETVFNLTEQPKRMVVVGAGPIGCELAQSFQRLGTDVTLVEMAPQILIREDPDAAKVVFESLKRDGVQFVLDARVKRVENAGGEKHVIAEVNGEERVIVADAILMGVGRAPNVEGLNLEKVGVEYDKFGVKVDDGLRTSNPRIFAAGDICLKYKFTHTADAAAQIVIQNALFGFLPKKARNSALTVPWCTYTDPEIAHVGLSTRDAEEQGIAIDTYVVPMSEVDRAISDGMEEGFIKVHTVKGKGQVLGATLIAHHAGDIISEVTAAMIAKKGLGTLASVIHPYPTQAEVIRKAAILYKKTLLSPFAAKVLSKLMAWQR
jgi:pyruvate/2-oxoglutarate dehydrogenase complex dihydrolipoamide dehydrogenase (E3) component